MARKSFLLASTLLEMMCQCPMATPVALNGAGCAAAPPAINVDASNKAANILVFMTTCLLHLRFWCGFWQRDANPIRTPGDAKGSPFRFAPELSPNFGDGKDQAAAA